MLHYILATLVVYIVFLAVFPQQVAAATLLLAAWLTNLDIWHTVPWTP